MGTSPQHHMHLPKGVLQCMCACNTCVLQCRCAHTACRACVSTGLLLLCCQHVGCACVQDVAAQESLRPCACAWRCARCLVKRGWPGAYCRGLCAAIVSAAWAQMLTAGQIAHKLIGRSGRQEGGGGAGSRSGVGGHGPRGGLERGRWVVRCGGRICWANAVWVSAM